MKDGGWSRAFRHPPSAIRACAGRLNHWIMFMLDRGKFRGHRKKSDEKDQALRVKRTEPKDDQIKYQAHGHRQRSTGDQLVPLGLCHGSPPGCRPNLRRIFIEDWDCTDVQSVLNGKSGARV